MKPFATLVALGSVVCLFVLAPASDAKNRLIQVSMDTFTNSGAQHKTEVESDNFAYGDTMVGAFQIGRYPDSGAGSSDIGFTTTTDAGKKFKYGYLPGITTTTDPKDPYARVTDPAVAYDLKHNEWLIISLPYSSTYGTYVVPIVSRSTDALHWDDPIAIAPSNGDFMDKPWIVCDDTKTSPYYGNCYAEYIDVNLGEVLFFSTSSDGGKTWSTPVETSAVGNGGQPVVQPNGNVIVPYLAGGEIETVNSTDGGASWQSPVFVANAKEAGLPAGLRDPCSSTPPRRRFRDRPRAP